MIKFVCPLIVVDEIIVSKRFYEELLGQNVKFDFVENVTFEGGFSIHQKTHFQDLIGGENSILSGKKSNNSELYFETEEIEAVSEKLKSADVVFIHHIKEQPWGQRVMRLRDPDGHIIEVGETLESMILRFANNGMSTDWICHKSSLPAEFVEKALQRKPLNLDKD